MVIQEILFPEIGKCTEKDLYYHTHQKNTGNDDHDLHNQPAESVDFNYEDKTLTFKNGDKAIFDTYFNSITIEKWKKYTVVNAISLKIAVKGIFRVTLLAKEKIHEDILETILDQQIVTADTKTEFSFDFVGGEGKGLYAFMLEALADDSCFYGGAYCSDIPEDKVRYAKIGICICTFRRESFIEKNLKLLNQAILENPSSDMYGHLEVFISDNGQTLDIDRLSTDKIHIYKNKNYGGAGGFTRALIEVYKGNEKYKVTHPLLMDDDIVIEPAALMKTFKILSLLKEEYLDAFIGGAMLRRDIQYRQVESGASWNGGALDSLKANLDLRYTEACLYNEWEEYTEFNAWWYCCFPISVVREDNLPLPIFIRGDDLEYGLRNMKHLILMNGICVWHEPFENKYSSFLEYYIMRNRLIDNSFHCQWFGAKQTVKIMVGHCFREIGLYRYKNVELYLQGIQDFLKGPQWLMQQDSETLHKKIMAAGYRGQDLDTLEVPFRYPQYDESRRHRDGKWRIWFRWLTFNGLFFKAKGDTCVPMSSVQMGQVYRKKRVLQYDVTSRKGFVVEKSLGTSLKYIFKTLGAAITIPFKLKKAQEAYRTEGLKLRTLEFWDEFLGLK